MILVVIDKFVKYGLFFTLAHPFTTLQVAQAYMTHVYRLHGLPKLLISDRDHIFTNHLWRELFRLLDTVLQMSSAYHPQTDRQTKQMNQCVETYLRCTVHANPKKWHEWLSLATQHITRPWGQHRLRHFTDRPLAIWEYQQMIHVSQLINKHCSKSELTLLK